MSPPAADLSAILEAAMEVFYRFGYRKTAMDDIAKAARLSRQGIYLKFSTKEQLFSAALEHVTRRLLTGVEEIAGQTDLDVEARLVLIFDALHGNMSSRANAVELLDHIRSKCGDTIARFDQDCVGIIEQLLIQAGIDKQWQPARITAKQLAEHLLTTASGIKSEYRARMAVAIALVARGACVDIAK